MKKIIEKENLFLILILLSSFFLNIYGIKWGLPNTERSQLSYSNISEIESALKDISKVIKNEGWKRSELSPQENIIIFTSYFDIIRSYNCDEEYVIKRLSCMDPSKLDFNPHAFIYPTFFLYMIGIVIKIASLFGFIILKSDINFYLLHPEEFAKFYIVGRAIAAIMGVFIVYLTYLLGKKVYNGETGLICALFITLCPVFVVNAHYVKVDVPTTFWFILSILFSIYILKSNEIKWYIFAGIFAGFAAGTKYPSGLVVLAIPFAHFLKTKENIFRVIINKNVLSGIGISFFPIFINPLYTESWRNFPPAITSVTLLNLYFFTMLRE